MIGVLILFAITVLLVRKILIMKEDYQRTLSLCFMKVTTPKKDSDMDEKKETTKDFKEMIGLMEQLLASFKSIHSHKIRKKIL